jgi:ABC-type transporter Mla subunit MlaD
LGELPADLAAVIARIEINEDAIKTLNGIGEGSVQKQINDAIDSFANKLTDDGTVNTFKELVEYAAENASDLGELILRVNNVETKNNEQDELIVSVQKNLEVFKGEVSMKFESNNAEIQQSIDNKITNAFTWENVQ